MTGVDIGIGGLHRCTTPAQREEMLYGIHECWNRVGDMRLGQFLENAVATWITKHGMEGNSKNVEHFLFYMEDLKILEACREYVRKHYPLAGRDATSS